MRPRRERERGVVRDGAVLLSSAPSTPRFNRDNTGFVTDLYNTFFNRAPDGGGLAFWMGQLQQGMPREVRARVVHVLARVRELHAGDLRQHRGARRGGHGDGLLSRPARAPARRRRLRLLGAELPRRAVQRHREGRGRGDLVGVRERREYLARSRTNAQYVGDLYNAFLRRGGDLGGVQFWIGQLNTGTHTREQVRGGSSTAANSRRA